MTLGEFIAWFEGYSEALAAPPNAEQWKRIRDRISEVGEPHGGVFRQLGQPGQLGQPNLGGYGSSISGVEQLQTFGRPQASQSRVNCFAGDNSA